MITKNRLILILGVWIALVPSLGFPTSYESFFVTVSGLAVALVAFLLARDRYRAQIQTPMQTSPNDVYKEGGPINGSPINGGPINNLTH